MRRADLEKERKFLKRSLQLAQEQVEALTGMQKEDDENLQARNEDVARIKGLTDQGSLHYATRRGTASAASSPQRAFTTANQMAQTKNGVMVVERRIEQSADQRRMDVMRELQDASVELEKLRARLQGIGDKLLYATTTRSQLALGKFGEPEIAIFRGGAKEQRLPVAEDADRAPVTLSRSRCGSRRRSIPECSSSDAPVSTPE